MQSVKINPFWLLAIMALLAVITLATIYFLKYIWWLGMILSPLWLLLAFFIKKSVVFDHFKNIGNEFWQNPIRGIFGAVLSFAALPIVSIYILLKAIFWHKLSEMQADNPFGMFGNLANEQRQAQQKEEKKNPSKGEYIEFEEVE